MRRGEVYRFRIPNGVGHEQHGGAVDAQRLGDRVDLLSPEEMWAVDDALVTVLGRT